MLASTAGASFPFVSSWLAFVCCAESDAGVFALDELDPHAARDAAMAPAKRQANNLFFLKAFPPLLTLIGT